LMKCSLGKVVAKGGAEGLLCVGVPAHGAGIAIRVADGNHRSHAVVIEAVLEQLDLLDRKLIADVRALHDDRIFNHNRRHVGDLRAAITLTAA
jgi:L-asparaginase II